MRIVFEGKHPGNPSDSEVVWLTWRQRVLLRDGLPYVEFITEMDWDTYNRRIRIAFPTKVRGDEGDYEIPYGTVRRGAYEPTYQATGQTAIGRQRSGRPRPAKGCVRRSSTAASAATGSRTARCSSPAASPGSPWCLHEPQFYRMPMFDGMRDAGKHEFRLALLPLRGPWQDSGITQRAWSYNAPLPAVADCLAAEPSMGLRLSANGTMISTVKKAEDGDALIVRLYEFTGRGKPSNCRSPTASPKPRASTCSNARHHLFRQGPLHPDRDEAVQAGDREGGELGFRVRGSVPFCDSLGDPSFSRQQIMRSADFSDSADPASLSIAAAIRGI